ncbi:unnamed protein product [Sympodiomycopsis kandeliae]
MARPKASLVNSKARNKDTNANTTHTSTTPSPNNSNRNDPLDLATRLDLATHMDVLESDFHQGLQDLKSDISFQIESTKYEQFRTMDDVLKRQEKKIDILIKTVQELVAQNEKGLTGLNTRIDAVQLQLSNMVTQTVPFYGLSFENNPTSANFSDKSGSPSALPSVKASNVSGAPDIKNGISFGSVSDIKADDKVDNGTRILKSNSKVQSLTTLFQVADTMQSNNKDPAAKKDSAGKTMPGVKQHVTKPVATSNTSVSASAQTKQHITQEAIKKTATVETVPDVDSNKNQSPVNVKEDHSASSHTEPISLVKKLQTLKDSVAKQNAYNRPVALPTPDPARVGTSAEADLKSIPRLCDTKFGDFDRWAAEVDRLWNAHRQDAVYIFELTLHAQSLCKSYMSIWVDKFDWSLLQRSTWPEIKKMVYESRKVNGMDAIDLGRFRIEIHPTESPEITELCGTMEFSAGDVLRDENNNPNQELDEKKWGSSLASGRLRGFFSKAAGKQPAESTTPVTPPVKEPATLVQDQPGTASKPQQDLNGDGKMLRTPPHSSQDSATRHKVNTGDSDANGKVPTTPPRSSQDSNASHKVTTRDSNGDGKVLATPSRSSQNSTASQNAKTGQTPSSPSPLPNSPSTSSKSATPNTSPCSKTSLPPLELDKSAPPAKPIEPPTFEDLVDVVGVLNGEPRNFTRWSRKIDELWYANDDPLYRKALLNALPSTVNCGIMHWLVHCPEDFFGKATWNDWKICLSTYCGGTYDDTEGTTSAFLQNIIKKNRKRNKRKNGKNKRNVPGIDSITL